MLEPAVITTDYLVVGAGPNGILLSNLLVKQGKNVTLIEAGGIAEESCLLDLNSYEFQSKSKLPKSVHLIGGGSTQWLGRIGEFIDSDFNSHLNRQSAWPVDKEILKPYFKMVFDLLFGSPLLDEEFIDTNTELAKIKSNLQNSITLRLFRFSNLSVFQQLLIESQSYSHFRIRPNLLGIELFQNYDKLYTLKCIDKEGNVTNFISKKVFIAGGTLQSTALLMRSTNLKIPAKDNYLGHYLMEHFDGFVGRIIIKNRKPSVLANICLDSERRFKKSNFGVAFTLNSNKIRELSLPNMHFEIVPFKKKFIFESHTYLLKIPEPIRIWLFNIERFLRKIYDPVMYLTGKILGQKSYSVWLKGEEFPFYDSCLQISNNSHIFGVPKLVYNHKISKHTSTQIRRGLTLMKRQVKSENLGKFLPYRHLMFRFKQFYLNPNWHPMGTTKIGENPATSICDINLELHSQKGVYLVNPGVFPTGSNQNPTSMMLALTFKLAEFLKSSS